jgi:hypothetical protein
LKWFKIHFVICFLELSYCCLSWWSHNQWLSFTIHSIFQKIMFCKLCFTGFKCCFFSIVL